MYGDHDNILRFLACAAIYFELTGKTANAMSPVDWEEFFACSKRSPTPEEFHKLIANKIRLQKNAMEKIDKVLAGGWSMLPPEQRVL